MRALASVAASLLLLGLSTPAQAARSFDPNRLTPAADCYGLIVSERAQVPAQWEIGTSAYVGYTHRPLTLPSGTLVNGQFTVDLSMSIGLLDFLALSAVLPVAGQVYNGALVGELVLPTGPMMPTTTTGLYRGARSNSGLAEAGPRDPRLTLKGRLWRGRSLGVALLTSVTIPVGNSDAFLGEAGVTFRPMAIVDATLGRFSLIGNLGATVRPASALADPQQVDAGGKPVAALGQGHELTFALGLAARVSSRLSFSLEAFGAAPLTGAVPLAGAATDAPVSADLDLLGAAWVHINPRVRLSAALGGSVLLSSPRQDPLRVLVGVSWAPAPRPGGLP